jgi:hypothetical protein
VMTVRSSFFWDIMLCTQGMSADVSEERVTSICRASKQVEACLLHDSHQFLGWLIEVEIKLWQMVSWSFLVLGLLLGLMIRFFLTCLVIPLGHWVPFLLPHTAHRDYGRGILAYLHTEIIHSQAKVKVIVQLMVSRPVCPGVRPPSGTQTIFFFFIFKEIIFRQLLLSYYGAPYLMRLWVCNLWLLLGLAGAVFLGSESSRTYDLISLSQF